MKLKHIAIVTGLMTMSAMALADNTGFYMGGKLGASIIQSKDVQSNGHFYDGQGYDYSSAKDKNKTVFNIGLNAGYDFNVIYGVPVRTELDYTYRTNADITTSDYVFSSMPASGGGVSEGGEYDSFSFKVKQSTLMVNSYYDFYNSSDFTPYVGVGLGMAFVKYSSEDESYSKTKFAWAAMAGVSYQVTSNLTANLEYRYLDSGKIKDESNDGIWYEESSAKLSSHDLTIGLRYAF